MSAETSSGPGSNIDPANTVENGTVVDASASPVAAPSPVSSLASGIGGVLLFPGQMIVQQFMGTSGGDPLDMSHLPITILLSAGAWYGLYWYLTRPGGLFHSKGEK